MYTGNTGISHTQHFRFIISGLINPGLAVTWN